MNQRPIETARSADLRHSMAALLRAAERARRLAAQTGTAIVISRNGVVQHIMSEAAGATNLVQETRAPYSDET